MIYWQEKIEGENNSYLENQYFTNLYFFSYSEELKWIKFSVSYSFESLIFNDLDDFKRMIRLKYNCNYELSQLKS